MNQVFDCVCEWTRRHDLCNASYFFCGTLVKELSRLFLRSPATESSVFMLLRGTIFSMPNKFTVGLIQMRSTSNAADNLASATAKIREAAKRGAQIICMDELFCGEYFCRTEEASLFDLAEPVPGPSTELLA